MNIRLVILLLVCSLCLGTHSNPKRFDWKCSDVVREMHGRTIGEIGVLITNRPRGAPAYYAWHPEQMYNWRPVCPDCRGPAKKHGWSKHVVCMASENCALLHPRYSCPTCSTSASTKTFTPGPAATREDSPSHEAPPSQAANPPEAVEASLTYEPSEISPNGDHNPPVSQPQVNAIWHPAILPPMNVDPLPFQPFDQQPFQPFDQQPLPLDPGPLSNSCSNLPRMTIGPSNPKEINLNDYMFAC